MMTLTAIVQVHGVDGDGGGNSDGSGADFPTRPMDHSAEPSSSSSAPAPKPSVAPPKKYFGADGSDPLTGHLHYVQTALAAILDCHDDEGGAAVAADLDELFKADEELFALHEADRDDFFEEINFSSASAASSLDEDNGHAKAKQSSKKAKRSKAELTNQNIANN